MSISSALNNALSGLRANTRASEVVSSNIANAMTENYARRSLSLSPNATGGIGGVSVNGIVRHVDQGLLSDTRMAMAASGFATNMADHHVQLENLIGDPENPNSLTARLAAFEGSLISAASRPDSPERLSQTVSSAQGVVSTLNDASDGVQELRMRADRSIDAQVTQLNEMLEQVQQLNSRITSARVQGSDTAALQDHRQEIVDGISTMVEVRQVPRDNGQVALYTTGGAVLIDGKAAEISFEPTRTIVPHMTQQAGLLSGLMLNGQPVETGNDGPLSGGTLAAQFEIRDTTSVAMQSQLDAAARDLSERFQDPSVDPTLTAGDAGLFTDAGLASDPANEVGLAGRMTLNAAVDPNQGGDAWRMRDGIGAASQGPVGEARVLQALSDSLTAKRPVASAAFGGQSLSAFDLSSQILSSAGQSRQNAEQSATFANISLTEMQQLRFADGVDTDAELQTLMVIEQAYAANARVLQTVDEMMNALMRI